MLNSEVIQDIINLKQSQVVDIGLNKFFQTNNSLNPVKFPMRESMEVFSLEPFVNAVQKQGPVVVNIESHQRVFAYSEVLTQNNEREIISSADMSMMFEPYKSGSKLSQEDMIVTLQSLFVHTPEHIALLKLISSLKNEKVQTSDDDGISQTVSAKAGVMLSTEVKIKNPWILHPFKSFPEIDAVGVPYILRVTQTSYGPQLALHECDGGRWKIATTAKIKDWLFSKLSDNKEVRIL